jgi:tetratricopeptide (TPR) repeat protein
LVLNLYQEKTMSNLRSSGATATTLSLQELIQSAEMLQVSGQHEEAINLYRQWLQHGRDEQKHIAWFNYGWLLQKLNKVDEAVNAYDQLTNNYARYLSGNTAAAA